MDVCGERIISLYFYRGNMRYDGFRPTLSSLQMSKTFKEYLQKFTPAACEHEVRNLLLCDFHEHALLFLLLNVFNSTYHYVQHRPFPRGTFMPIASHSNVTHYYAERDLKSPIQVIGEHEFDRMFCTAFELLDLFNTHMTTVQVWPRKPKQECGEGVMLGRSLLPSFKT